MGDEKKIVGYWISEKKRQKFNWEEFHEQCAKEGLLLKMVSGHDFFQKSESRFKILQKTFLCLNK